MARVLCLHGLGGTGATMWPLIAALSDANHVAFAPTLPGHGGVPADLIGVSWAEWLATAMDWPADVVVGQSMGGALALAVAATGRCRSAVAINAPAPDLDALEGLEWRRSRGTTWVDAPAAMPGELAFDRLPISALVEMAAGVAAIDLVAITCPVLVINSEHDDVVDPAGGVTIARALSGPVQRGTLATGGHTATLDSARADLCRLVTSFVGQL